MEISFDPEKDAANMAKHRVSLANAGRIEWESAVTWPDLRQDYNKVRFAGIGYIDLRLFYVVFVDRDESRRIINLRKANSR